MVVGTAILCGLGSRCHRARQIAAHRVALLCYPPNTPSSAESEHRTPPSYDMRIAVVARFPQRYSRSYHRYLVRALRRIRRQQLRHQFRLPVIRTWPPPTSRAAKRPPDRPERPTFRPIRAAVNRCISALRCRRHAGSGRIRRLVRFRHLLIRPIVRDRP